MDTLRQLQCTLCRPRLASCEPLPASSTRDVDALANLLERVQVCSLPTSEGSLARHAAATLHGTGCRQRQACKHGLRAAAQERQVNWVVREYGNSASIPTSVLLSFLRQELQARHSAGALSERCACLRAPTPTRGRLRASRLAPSPAAAPAALHSVTPGAACRAWIWRRRSALRRRPRQRLATLSTRWRSATSSTRSRGGQGRTAWPALYRGPICRAQALEVRTFPRAAAAEGGRSRVPGGALGRRGDHVCRAAERVLCSAPGDGNQQGGAARAQCWGDCAGRLLPRRVYLLGQGQRQHRSPECESSHRQLSV